MTLVERRIGLLFAFFLALLAVAGLRATWMVTIRGGSLSSAAAQQQQRDQVVPARRGTILDRRGEPLAVSEPADDISATPYLVKDPVRAAQKLAPLLGQSEADVVRSLARKDTGFVYLARRLPAADADRIQKLNVAGIDVTPGSRRTYPRSLLAAQVIGATDVDGKGLFGLEFGMDRTLHGQDGARSSVLDGGRQAIEMRDVRTAVSGKSVRVTIDAEVQQRAEDVLAGVGQTYRPKGATAIVMDPRTGAILAMANWPRVDANHPGEAPAYATHNRAVDFPYEPGSTFKPFTVAGALQDRKVTPETKFNLAPSIQVADRVINESHARGWETLSTGEILAQSSNVGAITVALRLGATKQAAERRFDHWVRQFGFGRRTGLGFPGEEQGLALKLKDYSGSSIGNLPIGQGELVTPIQMATAYAALANGGVLRSPRLVDRVDGRKVPLARGRRIISRRTSAQVRAMLQGVFRPGGTASEVSIPGYVLAGKTGTANKIDPGTAEYSKTRYIASFVGFAPARDPKLLVSVVVDEPQGAIYGGEVAAPAFGEIAKFALPYLAIPPS